MSYARLFVLAALAVCLGALPALASGTYPVPVPKPPKTDVNVTTYVFPGWYRQAGTTDYDYPNHDEYSEWRTCISQYSTPRPLLGFYDDSLPEVNDWHIKWALESGISTFLFDWYWNAGEKRLAWTLEKGFLKAKYSNMMKFAIHWCNHTVDWPVPLDFSQPALEEMTRYCADNYFKLPNYLSLGGRPVLAIYDMAPILAANGGAEGFSKKVLPALNAILHERGLGDLFIILVDNNPLKVGNLGVGDAFTGYALSWLTADTPWAPGTSAPYKEEVESMPAMWKAAKAMETPFIVSTQAGWDDTPRAGLSNRWVRTGNTPELFGQSLQNAKPFIDPKLPLVVIEAWNEWGEGSVIEPSKRDGFGYLDAIRSAFAPEAPRNVWAMPNPEQVLSYSLLTKEELSAAAAKELTPEPPAPYTQPLTRVRIDPTPEELAGPVVASWVFDSPKAMSGWSLGNLSKPVLKDGRMLMKVTNADPQMNKSGNWGKASAIRGIAFRAKCSASVSQSQYFWATDKAGFSEQSSRRFFLLADGAFHTYTIDFNEALEVAGLLKTIRLDFPDQKGTEIELEWVKLLGR